MQRIVTTTLNGFPPTGLNSVAWVRKFPFLVMIKVPYQPDWTSQGSPMTKKTEPTETAVSLMTMNAAAGGIVDLCQRGRWLSLRRFGDLRDHSYCLPLEVGMVNSFLRAGCMYRHAEISLRRITRIQWELLCRRHQITGLVSNLLLFAWRCELL